MMQRPVDERAPVRIPAAARWVIPPGGVIARGRSRRVSIGGRIGVTVVVRVCGTRAQRGADREGAETDGSGLG
jgi:hypothetical protein